MSTLKAQNLQNLSGTTVLTTDTNGVITTGFFRNESPRVFVAGNQQAYTAPNANGEVPWNLVLQGNARGISAFNTSNGRFIAPISGDYLVSVFTLIQTAASHEWWIVKNGTKVSRHYSENGRTISGTCIITCTVNDYIAVAAQSNSFYLHSTDPYSGMTVAFLG